MKNLEILNAANTQDTNSKLSLKAVIAIDFGTSRSGYAYALSPVNLQDVNIDAVKSEIEIVGRTEWAGGRDMPYIKTLTQLLYSPDRKVEAWGYEARTRLAELRQQGNAKEYSYFKNFKMALYEGKNRSSDGVIIENSRKEEFLVLDIVADYLQQMKDIVIKDIGEATSGVLQEEEILWCLTVPAIWTDGNKQLMRRAAVKAGLITESDVDEERLLLILEPEAAAIYCQEKESISLEVGTCFMVVDCGGGTIDITVHEVESGKELKEVVNGTGGAYGSTKIDDSFIKNFLGSKLSPEAVVAYHDKHPIDFLATEAEWERIKCNFDPKQIKKITYFTISPKFGRLLKEDFPDVLIKLAEEQERDIDSIHLNYQTMMDIFQPTLEGVINQVEEQFKKLGNRQCDLIYLVGGFAQSPLLQELIKTKFSGKVTNKIVIPPKPGEAVVKGAVSFGLNPSVIRSRRSRLTYGCGCAYPFNDNIDPISKRYYDEYEEEYYCTDRFCMFVLAGDSIKIDEKVNHFYVPHKPNQTEMKLTVYATKKTDPKEIRYIDQPGFVKLSELEVEMPDTKGGRDRRVEVAMYFGRTEIKVVVTDLTSGKSCQSNLRFFSTFSPEIIGD